MQMRSCSQTMPSKKLGSTHHCSRSFTNRVVYSSHFENKELFDPLVITNLKKLPVCEELSYSDVLKKNVHRKNANVSGSSNVSADNIVFKSHNSAVKQCSQKDQNVESTNHGQFKYKKIAQASQRQ